MYLTLGRAEPAPRIITETPGRVTPLPLARVLDSKTKEFGAICRVYTQMHGGHSVGSGVLITPRHVLTCAHVIRPPDNPNEVLSITAFVAQNGSDGTPGIRANGWAVAPGWTPLDCRTYDHDFGIIRLSKAVTTDAWPVEPFDARRLTGKAAYLAGYGSEDDEDREARLMFRSRGAIKGSMGIVWCQGQDQIRWSHVPRVADATRLVWHDLATKKKMSGGPMWSFIDNQRVLWGLHAGKIDNINKKAILLNTSVLRQIAHMVSRVLPA